MDKEKQMVTVSGKMKYNQISRKISISSNKRRI